MKTQLSAGSTFSHQKCFTTLCFIIPIDCAHLNFVLHCLKCSCFDIFLRIATSIPGPFLELGREKALASAAHMTPRISGCKNMLISVVSVSVCINNKSEK